MSSKALLLVQPEHSQLDLASPLRAAGWNVKRTARLTHEGPDFLERCHLGMIILDPIDSVDRRDVERLSTFGTMEWIAVLPHAALQQIELARAVLANCYDFHTLPIDLERLLVVLGHALGRLRVAHSLSELALDGERRFGMIGRSASMRAMYRDLDKITRVDAPVLISGESGTGKELAARAIHRHSARRDGPFVALNCGSLPAQLIQSELFGYEKGSFTGAQQRKIGSIESAAGGVVFLDEIGDLPLELQAILLRFLQEKTIVRVGATRAVSVNVRVIAATHIDLQAAVARGQFREDLYYRLSVLPLNLPPLRERADDIELIAKSCFQQVEPAVNRRLRGLSSAALDAMRAHRWPGNVRELINRVQKAIIMSEQPWIMPSDLGLVPPADLQDLQHTLSHARAAHETNVIQQSLARHRGNISATARALGVSRVTLYRLMEKLRIELR